VTNVKRTRSTIVAEGMQNGQEAQGRLGACVIGALDGQSGDRKRKREGMRTATASARVAINRSNRQPGTMRSRR
jgi:hypothetical protein